MDGKDRYKGNEGYDGSQVFIGEAMHEHRIGRMYGAEEINEDMYV